MRKPTAIFTADRHYRDSTPRCRCDDFWSELVKKHNVITSLQSKFNVPCLDAGDFFDIWDCSAFLEGFLIRNLTGRTISVPGNHEMPGHNISKLNRSSLSVLESAGVIELVEGCYKDPIKIPSTSNKYDFHLVYGFPFGSSFDKKAELEIPDKYKGYKFLKIAIAHIFAYTEHKNWMSKEAVKVSAINRLTPQFDLVITGHNHAHFISKTKENIVINPGSMMRTRTNQINYNPAVFLWYDEDNSIDAVPFKISKDAVIKENIKVASLSESLTEEIDTEDIEVLFRNNLQLYYNKHSTRQEVIDYIEKSRG